MAKAEMLGGPCDGSLVQISFMFLPPSHLTIPESGEVSGMANHIYELNGYYNQSKENVDYQYIYVDTNYHA